MPIETQVADLQASVTDLIAAINIKKAALDQAVTDAQAAANIATNIETISNAAALEAAVTDAQTAATAADEARDQALTVAALYPALAGYANHIPRINSGATAMEYRSVSQFKTDLGLGATDAVTFGAFSLGAPVTKTADFTLGANENYVSNNKSGSACVVTLPAASAHVGRILKLVNGANGQALNSASANVVPISGAVAQNVILPAGTGHWATLVSNGTNWVIVESGAGSGYLLLSDLAPSAVRLLSEGLATPTDAELATTAWAAGYADSKVTGLLVSNFSAAAIRNSASGFLLPLDVELATAKWAADYADAKAIEAADAAVADANAYTDAGILAATTDIPFSAFAAATVRVVADGYTGLTNTELVSAAWVEGYVKTNPWSFTSAQQTITASSTVTIAHGLTAKPTEVQVVAICLTAQAPYAVGDEVVPLGGMSFSWDATNIYIRTGTALNGQSATGATLALTAGSFRYIARAR